MRTGWCLPILGLLFCAGCAVQPAPYPDGLHWFRDSAEQRAVYVEIYREATEAARVLSRGLDERSWGVILDIDETILDNSEYQRRLALRGRQYTSDSWNAWVQESAATVLPGAKDFTDAVREELHGQVILITNRSQTQCAVTEDNLHRVLIRYDRILCDAVGKGDKNERFARVIAGEPPQLPPVNVLIWVGDNVQDFPNLTQSSPGDPSEFGRRYFILPNPMYGSWTNVMPR